MANTKGVADHKAANTTTIPGLTVERTKSIVLRPAAGGNP